MKLRFLLWYVLPLVLYMGCIVVSSSFSDLPTIRGVIADEHIPEGAWTGDEIEHIIVYGFLAFLFYRMLMQTQYYIVGIIGTILFCVLFGFTDEIHQIFVSGRTFSMLDLVWDYVGALTVVFTSRSVNYINQSQSIALYPRLAQR